MYILCTYVHEYCTYVRTYARTYMSIIHVRMHAHTYLQMDVPCTYVCMYVLETRTTRGGLRMHASTRGN